MQAIILYHAHKGLLNFIIKNQHKHVPHLEHHFDLKKPRSHVWLFILPYFLAFELYIFLLFCIYFIDVIWATEHQ